jgi:IclR family transcriptional regulator, acetate operon repressor
MELPALGLAPRYPIESVDNALQLLALFATEETIRVKDAADILHVASGTAHRLLAMLAYRGFVTQDEGSKAYVAGPMLLSVGLRASTRLDLTAHARPHLNRLHAECDETISLAVLQDSQVLFIEGVESTKVLRVTSRAGQIHPAHCTSVGKAMLATIPRERLLQLYPTEDLRQVTARSISTRTQLLLELESTAARGYAINFGELEDGIGSVAAVVRDLSGTVVAALGVGAPVSRLGDGALERLAAAARSTAEDVGDELPPFAHTATHRRATVSEIESAAGQDIPDG